MKEFIEKEIKKMIHHLDSAHRHMDRAMDIKYRLVDTVVKKGNEADQKNTTQLLSLVLTKFQSQKQ